MVFGVVTSDDFMPPFLGGPRLDTEVYVKCLEKVVLASIERVAPGRA